MKHIVRLTFFLAFSITAANSFAHKQPTHQYILQQAYILLKKQLGVQTIPAIENWIGAIGDGEDQEKPFADGTVQAGIWQEDENDPVYHYDWITPYTGAVSVSFSHFWNADNFTFNDPGTLLTNAPPCIGLWLLPIHAYADIENSNAKIHKYFQGGWEVSGLIYIINFHYEYWIVRYNGLINLFNNGNVHLIKAFALPSFSLIEENVPQTLTEGKF